jgi:hypothetical protein
VRRLYSTFADGWPGLGLLLIRLAVGLPLIVSAGPGLWNQPLPTMLPSGLLVGAGILLVAGLWTPVAGALVAAIAAWGVLTRNPQPPVEMLAGAMTGALALLGPGRWSVDARLFGWKRIDMPRRGSSSRY